MWGARRETNSDDGPRPNNGEPAPVHGWRRASSRLVALLFLLVGLACIGFPLAMTFLDGGPALGQDTLAFFEVGSDADVPMVTAVTCTRKASGGRHSAVSYDCTLRLAAPGTARAAPVGGRTFANPIPVPVPLNAAIPATLTRELPVDRTGQIPTVRRLWGEGADAVYGVVWDGGELAGRWWAWLLESALFWVFGAVAIVAAVVSWRRARRMPMTD